MVWIKFNNADNVVNATVTPQGDHIVSLKFPDSVIVNTSGFRLFMDEKMEYDIGGDAYIGYTTIYRNDAETAKYNGYQLSNDGRIYTPPVPKVTYTTAGNGRLEGETVQNANDYSELIIPTPVPGENFAFDKWSPDIPFSGKIEENKTFTAIFNYVPTLEEVKEQKIAEMNAIEKQQIADGVEVLLEDGTVEHFTLSDHDQTDLMALQTQVMAGIEKIPWHTSDHTEGCKYYSNADMARIIEKAMGWVTWHMTYFINLRIFINVLDTKEAVENIEYGVYIPEEYQDEVMKDLYAKANA